jgi:hypothetical protein
MSSSKMFESRCGRQAMTKHERGPSEASLQYE